MYIFVFHTYTDLPTGHGEIQGGDRRGRPPILYAFIILFTYAFTYVYVYMCVNYVYINV
jgi:hypothetical protein